MTYNSSDTPAFQQQGSKSLLAPSLTSSRICIILLSVFIIAIGFLLFILYANKDLNRNRLSTQEQISTSSPIVPPPSPTSLPLAKIKEGYKQISYHYKSLGFSFLYPEEYEVHMGWRITISKWSTGEGKKIFIGDIDFVSNTQLLPREPEKILSFEEHAADRALASCAADSPMGSIYCPEILRSKPFVSNNGVQGIEMYLKEVSKNYHSEGTTTSEREKGPIYVFELPKWTNEIRSLMFTLGEKSEVTKFKEIVESLKWE